MTRLIVALALLLAPVSVSAHNPIMPAPAIVCPAPQLIVSGAVSPSDIPVDCMRAYAEAALHSSMMLEELRGGSITKSMENQSAVTLPSFEHYQILALQGTDGLGVRVRDGSLSFKDGRFTGGVGCNHFGAAATVAEDGAVTFSGEIYSTLMFCPDLASAESLFAAIINGNGLVLTPGALMSSAGEITLMPVDVITGGNGPDHGIGYGIGGMMGEMFADASPTAPATGMHEHGDRHGSSNSAANLLLLLLGAATGFVVARATAADPVVAATSGKPAAKRRKRATK